MPPDFAALDCVLVIAFFHNVKNCFVEWHVFKHVLCCFTGEDKEVSYMTYQLFVFMSCFIGHSLYVYNRKVFQYVLPHIINEGFLSGYQISKFTMA